MPIYKGSTQIDKLFRGTNEITDIYKGTLRKYQNIVYDYVFTNFTSWSNDPNCVATGPIDCNKDNIGAVEVECQTIVGSWSGYSSITSATQTYPANGTQVEVQRRTRPVSGNPNQTQRRTRTLSSVTVNAIQQKELWGAYRWIEPNNLWSYPNPANLEWQVVSSCTPNPAGMQNLDCLEDWNVVLGGAPRGWFRAGQEPNCIQPGCVGWQCPSPGIGPNFNPLRICQEGPVNTCNVGSWGSWVNTSCSQRFGSGNCSHLLNRECRTVNTCSVGSWSGWSNVSSCSQSNPACGRSAECQRRTRTATLQKRTKVCQQIIVN